MAARCDFAKAIPDLYAHLDRIEGTIWGINVRLLGLESKAGMPLSIDDRIVEEAWRADESRRWAHREAQAEAERTKSNSRSSDSCGG
jgi:hypothetical protein